MKHWKAWGIAGIVLVIVLTVGVTYLVTQKILSDKKASSGGCKYVGPVIPANMNIPANGTASNVQSGAGGSGSGSAGSGGAAAMPPPATVQQASQQAQANLHSRALQAARGAYAQSMATSAGAPAATQGFHAGHAAMADGTGKLPPVLAQPPGDAMYHMAPTAIKHTSTTTDPGAFHDSTADMARFDPHGAARIDRALSMSGVPSSFLYSDAAAAEHKRVHTMKNMLLAGKVDPTVEEVLSAASPFTATARQIRSAVLAQGSIDRATVIATPLSKLYQNPLYRAPTPMPTMSVLPQDGMTPGQQFAYQSLACAASGAPLTSESY
jgi:hypothetical protein